MAGDGGPETENRKCKRMSYNKCIFIGNLTRDVELKALPTGVMVAEIGFAVNRTWRTEDGEKHEECSFFTAVAFGKRAETLAEYVKKGHAVLLETRAQQQSWDDKKTGEKRHAIKFIVESFTFLNQSDRGRVQPSDNDEGPPARTKSAAAQTTAKARAESPPVDENDDVPF